MYRIITENFLCFFSHYSLQPFLFEFNWIRGSFLLECRQKSTRMSIHIFVGTRRFSTAPCRWATQTLVAKYSRNRLYATMEKKKGLHILNGTICFSVMRSATTSPLERWVDYKVPNTGRCSSNFLLTGSRRPFRGPHAEWMLKIKFHKSLPTTGSVLFQLLLDLNDILIINVDSWHFTYTYLSVL